MNSKTTLATILSLTVAAGALAGCTNKTESEKTQDQAAKLSSAAEMMQKGEGMERDGAAMIARGKTLKDQGDMTGGDKLINDGEMMANQGKAAVEQGRKMKMMSNQP